MLIIVFYRNCWIPLEVGLLSLSVKYNTVVFRYVSPPNKKFCIFYSWVLKTSISLVFKMTEVEWCRHFTLLHLLNLAFRNLDFMNSQKMFTACEFSFNKCIKDIFHFSWFGKSGC